MNLTIGVLALQGAFHEHITLLHQAVSILSKEEQQDLSSEGRGKVAESSYTFTITEVRTVSELGRCDALIIPGGESTTMSLVAARTGLLEPLREFVK